MATNEFLPFANIGGANVMTQNDYEALTARSTGFTAGVAQSVQLNKVWRQSSLMSSAVAEFINDTLNENVLDNGDRDALAALFLKALQRQTRKRLTADLHLYVSTAGNDLNDGLSFGTPFSTIQRAWNVLVGGYDLSGFSCIIHVADGTYTSPFMFSSTPVGAGPSSTVILEGNLISPASVFVNVTLAPAIQIYNIACNVILRGFRISASGTPGTYIADGHGLTVANAQVMIDRMHFHTCGGAQIIVWGGGLVFTNTAPYSITGGAMWHALANRSGTFVPVRSNITLVGTPAFSQGFVAASHGGGMEIYDMIFTGGATGYRYAAQFNGTIFVNGGGPNYLPGSTPGIIDTGGQYA